MNWDWIMHVLRFLLVVLIALQATLSLVPAAYGASGPCPDWSPLQPLFVNPNPAEPLNNIATSLVVDEHGLAHLVWLSQPVRTSDGSQDVFMYSRWNGESWTQPIDIFAASATLGIGWPVLVPEPGGKLHLFWSRGNAIIHSWAWAEQAESARAWTPPEVVVSGSAATSSPIDVKLDAKGRFHVVFAERTGDVRYANFTDGSQTSSDPIPVSSVEPGNAVAILPKISISPQTGVIHVVWTEFPLPSGSSLSVSYARSTDGGSTWVNPVEMGGQFTSDGNVLALDDRVVYIAWNGGIGVAGRYFRWSPDGGVTWGNTLNFSDRAGQSSYPSLVQDSANTIHVLTGDGEYTNWDGRNLTTVCELAPWDQERSRLAVINGNKLLVVFPRIDGKSVDFAVKDLPVPAIPTAMSSPSSSAHATTPTATPTLAAVVVVLADQTPTPVRPFDRSLEPPQNGSSATPILIAVLSSGTVVFLAILWRVRSRRS